MLSKANIEKRLLFAQTFQEKPTSFWDNVIFCDETKIMLYYNDGPSRVWRKPLTALDPRNIIPTVKFGKLSIMVWGCISSKGVGELAFIENTMDAKQYLDILKSNLLASAKIFGFYEENKPKFQFYQDNDPKHKAKKKVAKRSPKNRAELKAAILEEWAKIPEKFDMKNLKNSMKKRLEEVFAAKGGHTKY